VSLSIITRKTMSKFGNGHGSVSKMKDLLYLQSNGIDMGTKIAD
jgi:hypothetical protein